MIKVILGSIFKIIGFTLFIVLLPFWFIGVIIPGLCIVIGKRLHEEVL